ncbi:hypothetical protein CERSUDRAFT_46500 [Gelatoporia subvermispora B]|uniref:CxC1-like cysteine cluster associated with KDZ transposases domain-containing protein n=1 Tax=Ceriporiopsis subvermispora (strain B) TaxID=914234 RepID=M2PU43_CERS8|nr:hypothetical protein CERSUDRAFT_46500 [Gelatoporia subvermispora B]
MAPSLRDQQPHVAGLGRPFQTPKKKSRQHPSNQQPVQFIGRSAQLAHLRQRLDSLRQAPLQGSSSGGPSQPTSNLLDDLPDASSEPSASAADISSSSDFPDGLETSLHSSPSKATSTSRDSPPPRAKRWRPAPERVMRSLYDWWKDLLPNLVDPMLGYMQRSAGHPVGTCFFLVYCCKTVGCNAKAQDVLLLFWDYYENVSVPFCECIPLPHVLIASGMFPTAPSQPCTAVSIDLLDFYSALFEHSGDAITALARALCKFYTRRGWRGSPIADPFRKPLGHAVQWYNSLRIVIERRINAAIEAARSNIIGHHQSGPAASISATQTEPLQTSTDSTCMDHPTEPSSTPTHLHPSSPPTDDCRTRRTCSPILQQRCPACFGGDTFGRRFGEGADMIVAADGNFSHRHMRNAGDIPSFYDPEYFIPKEDVDRIGAFIDQQHKKAPNKSWVPKVPDEAVDSCKSGHEAADEQKAKTNADRFDDTGMMALVCSHDIPLFGEQQKQVLTLFIHLFSLIPDNATVVGLYDIGCVVDRSFGRYDLLPPEVASRLMWALSAMHAYGNEWSCHLVYNPRLQPGLGLRDGEGVEQLWSRLRVFIPVTRTSAKSRRIWILDRQLHAIGSEMRDNLGNWIACKLKHGVHEQYTEAQNIVVPAKFAVEKLREQWKLQFNAQLSIRARTLYLNTHAETLYISLNISQMFPELKNVDAEVVRVIMLAHDLKIYIRKRVVAQLLEFDRIDRAAGGKDNPLGTKLHQQTRKAISRRQPAILSAIRKFNRYCVKVGQLAAKHQVPPHLPIPQPLLTNLAVLRDDPMLFEDVWIVPPSSSDRPQWLEDADLHRAIRALHKLDWCVEEEARLYREAQNMCQWFGLELAATQLATQTSEST